MKKYKNLIPVLMILLMAVSVYSTVSAAQNEKTEYEAYLAEARKLRSLDIIEDALANYRKALDIRDTIEISLEVGEIYVDHEWLSESITWGEYLVEHFPKEPDAYLFLLKRYIDAEQYDNCFELQKQALARKIQNQDFNDLMQTIEYVFQLGYDMYDDVGIFSGGYCPVENDGLWGYADASGVKEIKEQFQWAGAFSSDGIAPVQDADGNFYYIADSGNKKIAVQHLEKCMALGMCIDGIIPAGDNGIFAYYDTEFNEIVKGGYTYATPLNGGIGAVAQGAEWFLIDSKGDYLTQESYEGFIMDGKGIVYRNDSAFARRGGKVLLLNSSGEQVGNQEYEDAMLFMEQDGYAAVKVGGKWGFIDKNGNMVIEPQYTAARSFCYGNAAVKTEGKWGFINTDGQLIIENQFEDARDFNSEGCAFVNWGGKWRMLMLVKYNY